MRGALKRAVEEYKNLTLRDWTLDDYGHYFDGIADYEQVSNDTYSYRRRFNDSFEMREVRQYTNFLDIDCRTGNGTVYYSERGSVKNAYCVTPSIAFRDACQAKLRRHGIDAQVEHLTQLPLRFHDGFFDGILFLETIEHISPNERLSLLEELYRVCKPGGELIMSMPNVLWEPMHSAAAILNYHFGEGPHRFLRNGTARSLLQQVGFRIQNERTTVLIPGGPDWFIRFGLFVEQTFRDTLMPLVGLRRIYICRKP